MKKIAIFVSDSQRAIQAAKKLKNFLQEQGIKPLLPLSPGSINEVELEPNAAPEEVRNEAQLLISVGGDGTFLKSASIIAGTDIPLLGFNLGTLGFLSEHPFESYTETLIELLSDRFSLEERMLLSCYIDRDGDRLFLGHALNEATLYRAAKPAPLRLSFKINGVNTGKFLADGMIVSSPVGSTAYSLSVGGPIVNHGVECMIMTAIAPHTLSARPLVLSPTDEISIFEAQRAKMSLSLDGHAHFEIKPNEVITISRCEKRLKIIAPTSDFYTILREKLHWINR